MRTFVLGNENCVLGFSLAGIEGHVVRTAAQLERELTTCLADRGLGALLITSDVAALSRARVDTLKIESTAPLVVEIPGQGDDGALPSLREFVQKAVGISLGGGDGNDHR
jgi:V/A-type H+/Na+-transporting ATPase subunit F